MRVLAASEPAAEERSNEDWFSVSPGLVVVLDGATARTETGCVHGVSWYTAQLGSSMSGLAADRARPLQSVLSEAIREVADRHPNCDLNNPGTPSAAVGLIRVLPPEVEYLALGDITILLDTVDGLRAITDERVDQTAIAERRAADKYPIGSAEKATALIEMKHAELAARNNPGGFWVAAADPSVSQHAIVGSMGWMDLLRLAVLTDGAARIVRMFELFDWRDLMSMAEANGPDEILRRVRKAEREDPVGRRWPRNKRSDDATVVYLGRVRSPSTSGG